MYTELLIYTPKYTEHSRPSTKHSHPPYPTHPTTLSEEDLWRRPVEVAQFLESLGRSGSL